MSASGSAAFAVDPFGPTSNPVAYVPCDATERARSAVERSIAAGRVAALVGPPGLGKTLVLHLVEARQREQRRALYVPFCTFAPDEFFWFVLNGLGEATFGPPRDTLLARAGCLLDRGGILLLVDDASALPLETARALADALYDAEGTLHLAFAALAGEDAERVCEVFGPTLDVVHLSEGLSEPEAHRYVETRLAYAGATPELVAAFDAETIAHLHRESGGVPRQMHHVAQQVVRRAVPETPPLRLRDVLAAAASPREPAPPFLPPPAPPPARRRESLPTDGAYRLARGRALDPATGRPLVGEDADTPARGPMGAPPRRRTAARRAAVASARPAAETAAAVPRPPRRPMGPSWRWTLLVGVAAFGFVFGLAGVFAWMDGRLPLHIPLPRAPRVIVPSAPPVPEPAPAAPAAAEPRAPEPPAEPPRAATPQPVAAEEPEPPSAPVAESVAEAPAEPEPVPAAAPLAPPVSVSINAIPWATVEVDGAPLGETPLAGIQLTPGLHTFRARMPDGTTREQTVDIAPDSHTVVFE